MNPNISEAGKNTRFTHRPANAGKKPSKLKKFFKENGMGVEDIRLVCSNLANLSIEKLAEVAADKSQPILVAGSARALLEDYKSGRTNTLSWLIDRGYGKALERMQLSGALDITTRTREERVERIKELEKKQHERETKNQVPGTVPEVRGDKDPMSGSEHASD